ncbi:uncharacterized protein AC631_05260 [Debaryomyces fabryi]|uniref:Uncharacterized protein n=1 Tax=Debaryomyces fabryi TaxID=58627 RepID=A0A0V1PRX3_9ASCO|nr:uncharacterized protein AC631_05260 [Debaryomyces fabryi]KRZ98981.1 hypothetical protein AC631_05260 [Debaryomyces fabryi]CUM45480.1 unnamed protein product [Debaryomyces fabryi]
MDAKIYLQSYGWKEGEALKQGGLKKPILVKHKKDTKGLGHDSNDAEAWWERLFDGQLKNLEVKNGSAGSVSFEQNSESVVKDVRKANSPLYRMFVKGTGLAGTVGKTKHTQVKSTKIDASKVFDAVTENLKGNETTNSKKSKKDKEMKAKKDSRNKKSKKDKKDKTEKKTEKVKKSKNLKSDKTEIDTKERKKEKKSKKIKSDKKAKSSKEDGKVRTSTASKSEKKRKREDKVDKCDTSSSKKKKRLATSD